MTETLLQKLEEKTIQLLAELESLRKEVTNLRGENSLLKSQKLTSNSKLESLVSLLDSLDVKDVPILGEHREEAFAN